MACDSFHMTRESWHWKLELILPHTDTHMRARAHAYIQKIRIFIIAFTQKKERKIYSFFCLLQYVYK